MALSAMVVGCNKEQEKEEVVKGDFLFSSYTGNVSKVGLNSDISLYWTSGDRLVVYSYNGDEIVCQDVTTLFSGQGSSVGRFAPETYSDSESWYDPDAESQDYDFYAWYPAVPVEDPVSKVISIPNVSSDQSESSGIGPYLICWAKAETNKSTLAAGSAPNLSFSPKSALLKLTLKNSRDSLITINSIKLEADANIAGDANLNLGTGDLGAGNTSVITYTPASPIVLASGAKTLVPVNVSMLPCAATNIAVTLKQGDTALSCVNLAFSGIESGNIYSKVAVFYPSPKRSVVINNSTTQTASSDVLEANKLYYGTANCLVMGANDTQGTLNIRLFESADGYTRSNIISSFETAVTSARVIWAEEDLYNDTNFGIIKADLNTLILSKSSGITGNALIGIYSDTDATDANLLWSFHLWCPADATVVNVISEGSSTPFTAYKLALGQITGADSDTYMYYQWGRKDPLGRANPGFIGNSLLTVYGANWTSVNGRTRTDVTNNNLTYARKNPTVFITDNSSTPYDWYPGTDATQNNNLWATTKATIFDPCPPGYRVAPKTLWDGTKGKEAGPLFESAGLWYVLGGFRYPFDGSAYDVASSGYYWSSEAVSSSVSAFNLPFNSGSYLGREDNNGRALGMGVRCVKD